MCADLDFTLVGKIHFAKCPRLQLSVGMSETLFKLKVAVSKPLAQ